MAATESGNPVPWILHNDSTVAHDDLPKLFGKQAPVVYFIDKSGEYGDLNIISLSIHKWPIQDENGNLTFNICIQEELDGFHYVCF